MLKVLFLMPVVSPVASAPAAPESVGPSIITSLPVSIASLTASPIDGVMGFLLCLV